MYLYTSQSGLTNKSQYEFIPIHGTDKEKKDLFDEKPLEDYGVSFSELKSYVDKWYQFFDLIIENLITRDPLKGSSH